MTSPAPRIMLAGLEDGATAGVVATAAAHLAMEQDAPAMVVLHEIDTHMVAGGLLGLVAGMVPLVEAKENQEAMLARAETAIQAEYGALDRPVLSITRRVSAGAPAAVSAREAVDVAVAMSAARWPRRPGRWWVASSRC